MKNVGDWSREFDLMYNNIMSNQAPGLDEYEKSVLLTQAQDGVVQMLYNGSLKDSFEETESVTAFLSPLVCQGTGTSVENPPYQIVSDSVVYSLPLNLMYRTYESCTLSTDMCGETTSVEAVVVPVTQDDFWRTYRDPFRNSNKRRVLRLDYSRITTNNGTTMAVTKYSELVGASGCTITAYKLRYIRRPNPIILASGLPEINGETTAMTCELDEALHETILTEAVKAAKLLWK